MKTAWDAIVRLGRNIARLARRFAVWISPPPRLCASAILVVFLASFLWWALGDRTWDTVFFFPERKSGRLHGEVHSLPRAWGGEARAGLVAAEYLLGPVDNEKLKPSFELGSRVESVIYRSGVLYVDLSPEVAAYADAAGADNLRKGLEGLRKTLSSSLPTARRVVITIGGMEPWAEGPGSEGKPADNGQTASKKGKIN